MAYAVPVLYKKKSQTLVAAQYNGESVGPILEDISWTHQWQAKRNPGTELSIDDVVPVSQPGVLRIVFNVPKEHRRETGFRECYLFWLVHYQMLPILSEKLNSYTRKGVDFLCIRNNANCYLVEQPSYSTTAGLCSSRVHAPWEYSCDYIGPNLQQYFLGGPDITPELEQRLFSKVIPARQSRWRRDIEHDNAFPMAGIAEMPVVEYKRRT